MKKPATPPVPSYLEGAPSLNHAASVNAPVIYFEHAPTFGTFNGTIRITLETSRLFSEGAGEATNDRVMVAHLRCSAGTARALISALENSLDMLDKAAGEPSVSATLN